MLSVFFFIILSPYDSFSQTNSTFDLTVQITESPDGLLHIHLQPDGEVPSFDGCGGAEGDGMELSLFFNFYDESNNLIHTVDLKQSDGTPILFENISNQSPKNYWFPNDLVYDYFVYLPPLNVPNPNVNGETLTCSSGIANIDKISTVRISTSLNIESCPPWNSITSTSVFLNLDYFGENIDTYQCDSNGECIFVLNEYDYSVPTNNGSGFPTLVPIPICGQMAVNNKPLK